MFNHPIQFNGRADRKRVAGVGFISLAVHSALIGAAAHATLRATEAKTNGVRDTTLVYDTSLIYLAPQPREEGPRPDPPAVKLEDMSLVPPPDITGLPRVDHQRTSDPRVPGEAGIEVGPSTGQMPLDEVYPEPIVEEKPAWLSFPPPEYPTLLKQANIEGTVMLAFVIDTMGRVEPRSIQVVQSPNPEFDRPARNSLAGALFRPARMHGRAVRVLASMRILFRIR